MLDSLLDSLAITPENVAALVDRRETDWRANLPTQRPYLTGLPTDVAALCGSEGVQKRLLDELRRVADEICEGKWLRVYAHKPHVTLVAQEMMGAEPHYRPWGDFVIAGQIEVDAQGELWQRDVGDNMIALTVAALIWEEAKYRETLRTHVLAALQYPTWGNSGFSTNMDLPCAHLSRGIAIARDWLPEIWSDSELDSMRALLQERLGEMMRGAYGAAYWAGNWPDNHCQTSLAALGMCGVAFLDEIPEAASWLAAAEIGFEGVAQGCHFDGSCYEGLPYWSYGVSFLLQYLETAREVMGSERFYKAPYLKNSFPYRLQSSTPALGATLPFGDAVKHDYYGPAFLLQALARQYQSPHAQWLAQSIPFASTGGADCEVWNLLWHDPNLRAEAPERELDAHFPDWDVAVTRNGWKPDDYVLAIKSGFTNRNHSHLDAGALALAWGDEWLLTAPGYGIVGPGFWDTKGKRWTYYSNSTESHSTLLINGCNQSFDRQARGVIETFEIAPDATRTLVDLTGAYPGVLSVKREIIHRRDREILISDAIELEENGTVEWLLQPGGTIEVREGKVRASGQHGALEAQMLWPAAPFEPRAPTRQHLDVAPESIRIHAVSQSGQSLRFVCRIALHKVESR